MKDAEVSPGVEKSSATQSFLEEDDETSNDGDEDLLVEVDVGGSFEASCPYCGEAVEIFLDPAGGSAQDYVEDCTVCCQAMTVQVRFSGDGQTDVSVDTTY
jgi:hypothetical protein